MELSVRKAWDKVQDHVSKILRGRTFDHRTHLGSEQWHTRQLSQKSVTARHFWTVSESNEYNHIQPTRSSTRTQQRTPRRVARRWPSLLSCRRFRCPTRNQDEATTESTHFVTASNRESTTKQIWYRGRRRIQRNVCRRGSRSLWSLPSTSSSCCRPNRSHMVCTLCFPLLSVYESGFGSDAYAFIAVHLCV